MGIPRIYRGLPEVNLASYDFYDLSTGTGYKTFYLSDVMEGNKTEVRILTNYVNYSSSGYWSGGSETNYDISINVPTTIQGDCIFNIFLGYSGTATADVSVKFYRVDKSGTEYQIGATTTKSCALANSNIVFSGKVYLTNTRILAGEKLRLNIELGDTNFRILHDPKGRDFSAAAGFIAGNSQINLPIKL